MQMKSLVELMTRDFVLSAGKFTQTFTQKLAITGCIACVEHTGPGPKPIIGGPMIKIEIYVICI